MGMATRGGRVCFLFISTIYGGDMLATMSSFNGDLNTFPHENDA